MKERKKQRLPDFDYGRPGWYFVTSCVKNSFYPLSVLSNAVSGESINIVGNGRDRSLQNKIKPLPELMGAFKTTSSKLIRQNIDPSFSWQKSYHDRIIRNDDELNRIRMYIRNNPANYKYKEC
ncbi:MAG: hypothetical protein DKM50_02080 [Candidatus Margulisiibacteriota bacterium]|nr:MAG: hypothetical protein DKM50_02080 [Candidatus Margulisiibacteriota bacterium]